MNLRRMKTSKKRVTRGLVMSNPCRHEFRPWNERCTSDDEGADCTEVPSNPDSFLEWFPEWCEKEYSGCEAVSFSDAYQALSTAYPSMVFEKNGYLYNGEYILGSKGSSGQGSYFGVTQASGKITLSPRWSFSKPYKHAALYSENEVKQI